MSKLEKNREAMRHTFEEYFEQENLEQDKKVLWGYINDIMVFADALKFPSADEDFDANEKSFIYTISELKQLHRRGYLLDQLQNHIGEMWGVDEANWTVLFYDDEVLDRALESLRFENK